MSRAELQVRVKEPPGTERSAVRPGSFSLKVVPPDRHLPPTHRRQELRKGGSREASRPAAPEAHGRSEKAERPGRDRDGRSVHSEGVPSAQSKRERQGSVTILARQSNFILSVPSGTATRHGAPCSQASGVPAPVRAPSTDTRCAASAPPPVRATPATKGARRASSQRGRRRLLPAPLRHSVMSGFPVCAWERTLRS